MLCLYFTLRALGNLGSQLFTSRNKKDNKNNENQLKLEEIWKFGSNNDYNMYYIMLAGSIQRGCERWFNRRRQTWKRREKERNRRGKRFLGGSRFHAVVDFLARSTSFFRFTYSSGSSGMSFSLCSDMILARPYLCLF